MRHGEVAMLLYVRQARVLGDKLARSVRRISGRSVVVLGEVADDHTALTRRMLDLQICTEEDIRRFAL